MQEKMTDDMSMPRVIDNGYMVPIVMVVIVA